MATNYKEISKKARLAVLDMVYEAQSSHIGSNFSVIDILAVLFEKADLNKDKIILSAGWKAASFYYFLAEKGFIPKEELKTYNKGSSRLIGLTEPGVPGVHFAGGSMGMGLPASVGFALSKKMKGEDGKVYCIMSDGELAIGTTWEALLLARHHNLDNLVVIIDNNGLQAMGKVFDTVKIATADLCIFAYERDIDGHDHNQIEDAFFRDTIPPGFHIIRAKTTKGKGVSFMENDNRWHYLNIDEDSYKKAKQEIENG